MGNYFTTPPPPPPPVIARWRDAKSAGWGNCRGSILALLDEKYQYSPEALDCINAIYTHMDRALDLHQGATHEMYQWCDQVESYIGGFLLCDDRADAAKLRDAILPLLDVAEKTMKTTIKSLESAILDVNAAIGLLIQFRVAINKSFAPNAGRLVAQRNAATLSLDAANACLVATRDALERARDALKRDMDLAKAIAATSGVVRVFIGMDTLALSDVQQQYLLQARE
ncbi:hypothetical protein SPRG_13008 [Saprolegnia parasitica CBS 223.65]|uniref:Uncharacterized protein n=1 Tax=Saprolegnia parasitica (strain CBS 223.65) TaxID=695850 RepID=A0A067BXY3_SAPPC|nr:hypothetical protein SPRG_13008 [Saprolegnia parasitica CBS 223.65]KDO21670.1 hypothetical protein SPRG_13008 [Saprolegnia parasitica CBS 223.65]|eukprot:XP_012207594.1 hypothetical protein SPRG_13008 [Saprolegnia parasitica CBS 223.65]